MERKHRDAPLCKTEWGERERDGTQHWLPNYAFYHFSHNTAPPFLHCPLHSCSCFCSALMIQLKNNHNIVICTSRDQQITSYCNSHTHAFLQALVEKRFNNQSVGRFVHHYSYSALTLADALTESRFSVSNPYVVYLLLVDLIWMSPLKAPWRPRVPQKLNP